MLYIILKNFMNDIMILQFKLKLKFPKKHNRKSQLSLQKGSKTHYSQFFRVEKEEEALPPIPTSEPPESPTDQQQQQQQAIKPRPLGLKKTPLSEQPKLRYAKTSGPVHVSINRRIEMPPAFLFPETEIPADLMQSEQQPPQQQAPQPQQQQQLDVTDSTAAVKRQLVSPALVCDELGDKLVDTDIVDALNVINIEDHKHK